MRNLLDFITKHYHWLVFLILEAAGLVMLFSYNSYQGAAWISSANTVAGLVYEGESNIRSFLNLKQENEDLQSRNLYLMHQVQTLREELDRQGIDTVNVPGINDPTPYNIIPAEVVQSSIDKRDNLITINKGEADGVHEDMGVVCGTGVVGIVYLTGEHHSVVIPILSSKSSISSKIERTNYFGYLKWEGGYSNLAYVDEIPRHAHFKLYERVVTSGYSAIFPPGIPVGKIIHVFNSPDGLSYRLQVQLYTDFGNLRHVSVIDNKAMHEQLQLIRAAQDSLSTNKGKSE
jgi:rod shape-determining protein MreC